MGSKTRNAKGTKKVTKYIVDFDDFCDNTAYTLDILDEVREKYPDFTCTLFTIPARTSGSTIAAAKTRPWLNLAPHGWFHTRGECLAWTQEEAEAKILAAKDMGIDYPVFRAPAWQLDGELYRACDKLGYVLATHNDYRPEFNGVREYVYNAAHLRPARSRGVHGHLSNVCGNYVKDMWEDGQLTFRAKREFLDMVEAATVEVRHAGV